MPRKNGLLNTMTKNKSYSKMFQRFNSNEITKKKREFKYFFLSSAYAFPLFYATFAGKGGG